MNRVTIFVTGVGTTLMVSVLGIVLSIFIPRRPVGQ